MKPLKVAEERAEKFIEKAEDVVGALRTALAFEDPNEDDSDFDDDKPRRAPKPPTAITYGRMLCTIKTATGSETGELPYHMQFDELIKENHKIISQLSLPVLKRKRDEQEESKDEPEQKKLKETQPKQPKEADGHTLAFQVKGGSVQAGGPVVIADQEFVPERGPYPFVASLESIKDPRRRIGFTKFDVDHRVRMGENVVRVRASLVKEPETRNPVFEVRVDGGPPQTGKVFIGKQDYTVEEGPAPFAASLWRGQRAIGFDQLDADREFFTEDGKFIVSVSKRYVI